MSKHEKEDQRRNTDAMNRFEPGSALSPIEDRNEYEQRLQALPQDQKELAQETARLADLCQYFSGQKMDVPTQILEQIRGLSRLRIRERIQVLVDVNRALMEYLNDVGQDSGIRQ